MTKYVKISVLARETAKKVCRGREQWIRYLDVASRLYKYPFEDQLLIYAQRPDATACASLEMWNERMFCWVNRGAKGIALIDGESERPKLRYVFDVSDVHKARRIGKDPFIWHLREEHKEVVLAELEHIYGSTNDSLPFENRIYEIAERIAEDFYEEAVDEVIDEAANSFLEDLDGDAVAVRFREMLVQSVSYTILKRCGCDMTEFDDEFTFDYIHEFNTLRTLSVLGSTTSELCEPVLIRIGRTIARYDRALLQNRRYTINHNHTERAVAGHESDIRKERGLSDSQSDTSEQEGAMLTKYGVLRKNYLKNYRRGIYTGLLLSGELLTHCLEIQEQAEERFEVLTQQLLKNQIVTEEMKQNDPLQWTKEMNRIYQQAEEIVLKELVYQ
ncbi:TnpV protein [Clostridium sp. AM49-4BH]|uniref:TnpV protein n=1 Tax=Clostridium sp. AM49-4BH TaxID=2293035 RepID=UPI0015FC4D48|nr:TnpV protein [Clostridium sp. AM49-4BH]